MNDPLHFKNLTLDPFQVEAIRAIERGHSVIVSAPTGAGKTVIAEYAIEKAMREGKEIIYTAPIKALSNQKFRDFTQDYPDRVGIMTGDVILNPEAPVLIMTTEIFRNIIFDAGEDRLKNVNTVIFDEIHYINDIARGTVWEESLIFAPQHIAFVCLSATIPNFNEFAEWMRGVRNKTIETVVETERPVPLEKRIWMPEYGFRDMKFLRRLEKEQSGQKLKRGRRFDYTPLVQHLRREDQLPCIFFHFSRMGCQALAMRYKGLNLLYPNERRDALATYDELCKKFGVTDRANAVVMRGLVKNGVAFHHAGVLPAIKEIIERLYTQGLVKLLFTTETFAVGINMPARSVVFESLMKHDGFTFRYLTAREFQQMSGRAGRRGIDPVGFAYSIVNPTEFSVDGIMKTFAREVESIESQFSLSYSSLLNLYDRFSHGIYEVCERSFNNYKNVYQVELLRERMRQMTEDIDELRKRDCLHGNFEQMERFLELRKKFFSYTDLAARNSKKKSAGFELREKIRSVRDTLNESPCEHCKRKKNCMAVMKRIKKHERDMEFISHDAVEVENIQRSTIARRLELLQDLDYADDQKLLPRGRIASQIFGYELQFTEMYFEGLFEELDEEGLNVLVSCIVFESRRGAPWRRIKEKRLQSAIDRADKLITHLRKLEQLRGLPNLVVPLDTGLCDVLLAWCRGADFEELRSGNLDDGDLVRNFRLVVDFLRQLKRAIVEPMFRDKVDRCIKLIYRDIVDAEAQLQTRMYGEEE